MQKEEYKRKTKENLLQKTHKTGQALKLKTAPHQQKMVEPSCVFMCSQNQYNVLTSSRLIIGCCKNAIVFRGLSFPHSKQITRSLNNFQANLTIFQPYFVNGIVLSRINFVNNKYLRFCIYQKIFLYLPKILYLPKDLFPLPVKILCSQNCFKGAKLLKNPISCWFRKGFFFNANF